MTSAPRGYTGPSMQELVPGADPYIAGLVARLRRCDGPLLRTASSPASSSQAGWLRASYDSGLNNRWPLN